MAGARHPATLGTHPRKLHRHHYRRLPQPPLPAAVRAPDTENTGPLPRPGNEDRQRAEGESPEDKAPRRHHLRSGTRRHRAGQHRAAQRRAVHRHRCQGQPRHHRLAGRKATSRQPALCGLRRTLLHRTGSLCPHPHPRPCPPQGALRRHPARLLSDGLRPRPRARQHRQQALPLPRHLPHLAQRGRGL